MLHQSRIFVGLLISFLLAVVYFTIFPLQSQILLYEIIALFIIVFFFWRISFVRYLSLSLLFIALGCFRVSIYTPNNTPEWINFHIGEEINMPVRVLEEPKINGKAQQIIAKPTGKIKGNIQVTTNQFPQYHFGDTLTISGKLDDLSPESEQYRGYFKSQEIYAFSVFPKIEKQYINYGFWHDIYFRIRKPLISVRLKYENIIGKILPEPQAGLLSGIILGSKANLSSELLLWLSLTGTIHIIALSGYNITIVSEFMRILTKRFSKKVSFWLPVMGIIAFVFATGLSSSVIRAAIMGIILLLANKSGRQSDALVSILFASVLMVFLNPNILVYDVGFQLSFAAVCGILFLAPRIEKFFSFFGKTMGQILAATFSAQLFSWPVTSYYFGVVSIVAPVANMLILPVIPFVMLLGFVAASIGFLSLWLGKILGLFVWVILSYFIKITEMLANTSFAASNYKISSGILILGYYLLLADFIMILSRRKKIGRKESIR